MKKLISAFSALAIFLSVFATGVEAGQPIAGQGTTVTAIGGTANAITGTAANATSYNDLQGVIIKITPTAANTSDTTLTLNGFGTSPHINKSNGAALTALVGGELQSGVPTLLMYDGTTFDIVGGDGGGKVSPPNLGTISSGTLTPNCGNAPLQYFTNGGAFNLAVPANDGSCDLLMINNGSAGAVTPSGSYIVGANTGEALTTTNTNKFIIHIEAIDGVPTYFIKALQ